MSGFPPPRSLAEVRRAFAARTIVLDAMIAALRGRAKEFGDPDGAYARSIRTLDAERAGLAERIATIDGELAHRAARLATAGG